MKRTLKLMPRYKPLEGDELDQCKAAYEHIWANGFIPFVRQYATISETPEYIRISPHRAITGLCRVGYIGGDRPGLEAEYKRFYDLVLQGYRARFTGGMASIILFKPEYQGKIPREIRPHEQEG